jgi:hypothetical protein
MEMDYTVSVDLSKAGKRVAVHEENGAVAEPWMIDELAHAGPEHLDAAFVAGYDRKQGYPDPAEFSTYRWLLEPMLAATGFEIVTADFSGRLYGAYTCVKSS